MICEAQKLAVHRCYWIKSFKFLAWARTHQTLMFYVPWLNMSINTKRYAFFSRLNHTKQKTHGSNNNSSNCFSFPSMRAPRSIVGWSMNAFYGILQFTPYEYVSFIVIICFAGVFDRDFLIQKYLVRVICVILML